MYGPPCGFWLPPEAAYCRPSPVCPQGVWLWPLVSRTPAESCPGHRPPSAKLWARSPHKGLSEPSLPLSTTPSYLNTHRSAGPSPEHFKAFPPFSNDSRAPWNNRRSPAWLEDWAASALGCYSRCPHFPKCLTFSSSPGAALVTLPASDGVSPLQKVTRAHHSQGPKALSTVLVSCAHACLCPLSPIRWQDP